MIVLGMAAKASVGEANKVAYQVTEMLSEILKPVLLKTAIMNEKSSGLPGIEEAAVRLIAKEAEQITIVPMFLTNGEHIQSDIPTEIKRIETRYPKLTIKMARHIGADMQIAEILAERLKEVQ